MKRAASLGLSVEQIAALLDVHKDTLYSASLREPMKAILRTQRAASLYNLRAKMFAAALRKPMSRAARHVAAHVAGWPERAELTGRDGDPLAVATTVEDLIALRDRLRQERKR